MIKKILIANRGEIAVRIQRACREMGIKSAAVFSDADKDSLHVRLSDEAYHIGASPSSESYLNIRKIIDTALKIGADAIHPGYGFLSEKAEFIRAVLDAGLIFIGPPPEAVELMGIKTAARKLMSRNNVPVVPGTIEPIVSIAEAKKSAGEIGYPVMLKAAAGGGGKGMRKVDSESDFDEAFAHARSEASKAFSDNAIYIEKFIENPKHIEVQIIGDKFGNYAHLYERECSIQRRHQKVIEEAPSAVLSEKTRKEITNAAINAARACGYYNAGTIEFLYDKSGSFYFLEMNTRLQVEHPVTEMVTGIDLVKEQIKIADGQKLSFTQDDISSFGHAVECRIYAEDASSNFAPSIGKIIHHRLPSGPGIRIDRGIEQNSDIPIFYDPMLSKLAAWGRTRSEAILRLIEALSEYQITGIKTNIPFCKWVLKSSEFQDASFDINFIDNTFMPLLPDNWEPEEPELEFAAKAMGVILKKKQSENSISKIECKPSNQWRNLLYE